MERTEREQKARVVMESLLQWGPAKLLPTARGERRVRTVIVPPEHKFWPIWRNQDAQRILKTIGIEVAILSRGYEVQWWEALTENEKQSREEAKQMSRATSAAIEVPFPPGKTPYPYQLAGIAFCRERAGVLLADEMGLGKTPQSIGVINDNLDKIHRAVVLCPGGLTINWDRELRAWLAKKYSIAIADGKCFPSTEIVICSYSIAHKWTKQLSYFWDLAILDEVHKLKNPGARMTRAILGGVSDEDDTISSGIPARRRLALTGTPIENRPVELYTVLRWLDPEAWRDRWHFLRRYCAAKRVMRTVWKNTVIDGKAKKQRLSIPGWDFSGADNLAELQERARSTVMIRRLKREVLPELPPKRRQVLVIPADLKKTIAKKETELGLKYDKELAPLQAAVALAKAGTTLDDYRKAVDRLRDGSRVAWNEMAKVSHEVALAKVPAAGDNIEATLEETNKVIVFCWHLDVMDQLEERFGKQCSRMDGNRNTKEKQAAVDRFQTDPTCKVILGNRTMYAGYTLTAASVVIFVELSWVPGDIMQAEDRAHRIGQKDSVLSKHLVANGSIEVNKVRGLVRKMDIIDQALDHEHSAIERDEPLFVATDRDAGNLTFKELQAAAAGMTQERIGLIMERLRTFAPANEYEQALARGLADKKILTAREAVLAEDLLARHK